jgi:hypothetical protein
MGIRICVCGIQDIVCVCKKRELIFSKLRDWLVLFGGTNCAPRSWVKHVLGYKTMNMPFIKEN